MLMRTAHVARYLRISTGTVRALIESGHLPAIKLCGSWLVPAVEVQRFAARRARRR